MLVIDRVTVGGEPALLIKSKYNRGEVQHRGIIIAHGYQQTADSYNPPGSTGFRYQYEILAAAGYTVLVPDLGGSSTWGNDTSIARMGDAFTYLTGRPGVKTDKILCLGSSMGNLAALNWTKANLNKVNAYVGLLPATNLQAIHDDAGLGLAVPIETAYGGAAGYSTGLPTHNPQAVAATYAGIPMKLFYSPDDAVTPPWMSQQFAAGVGPSAVAEKIDGATGHSDMALNPYKVLTFLNKYV